MSVLVWLGNHWPINRLIAWLFPNGVDCMPVAAVFGFLLACYGWEHSAACLIVGFWLCLLALLVWRLHSRPVQPRRGGELPSRVYRAVGREPFDFTQEDEAQFHRLYERTHR